MKKVKIVMMLLLAGCLLAGLYGVPAATDTPDINISDGTLQFNTAATDGGAIYLDDGTLDFDGWWDVQNNHADGNGGAVAVLEGAQLLECLAALERRALEAHEIHQEVPTVGVDPLTVLRPRPFRSHRR